MKYERLKITAKIKGNIIINNDMLFDGILYYAFRKKQTEEYCNLPRFSEKKEKLNVKLPLKKKFNVYLASRAYYRVIKEYNDFFHRRFLEVDASEWMEPKRVYLDQKTTKNWRKSNIVYALKNNEIWWYAIGDREEIEKLLKEVYTIGKESNQGFGIVESWTVEPTTKRGSRIFPDKNGKLWRTFRPPYGNSKNNAKCSVKRF